MTLDHVCTYRLQLNPDFGFDDAAAVVPYLARLGVSHVYLSPITQAAPGSAHGYDVADPTSLNAELGGLEAYSRLCAALEEYGIGEIVDIVPNHMAVVLPQNRWLDAVLRDGPASPYAAYFDLRWSTGADGAPYIELPVLGADCEQVLATGELSLAREADGPRIRYYDFAFPLRPGTEPENLDLSAEEFHALLQKQHYRLVYWRTADERLSYRRFFDISGLIALRMDHDAAFEDAHSLVLRLVRSGAVQGLRIDHIDGLADPEGYLRRLRGEAPGVRMVVEKILGAEERLPPWPVEGTTGYDFLNLLNGLFVDPAGEEDLTRFYAEFTGTTDDYPAALERSKRLATQQLFEPELAELVALGRRVADEARIAVTPDDLDRALRELLAALPVYRTYVRPDNAPSAEDVALLEEATNRASRVLPETAAHVLDLLRDALLLHRGGEVAAELTRRFQQLSGPVMAKGAEDTAFYNYHRLVSLNEVGGEPSRFGVSVDEFHTACQETAARRPLTMLATATHDTKRGEDVRARQDALSEAPQRWIDAVQRWGAMNEHLRSDGFPDRNAEYLFYQTVAGAWPLDAARAWQYMQKAAREAKAYTDWRQPDEAYESALRRFVEGALANEAFTSDVARFASDLDATARPTSLAQTLVKLTAPGVPDLYQGTELWDLSLVDPDNRRPVDYEWRDRILETALRVGPAEALKGLDTGLAKLWLIERALEVRRAHPRAFLGDYEPLAVTGGRAEHVVAFLRGGQAVTVVPRLVRGLGGDWQATTLDLPPGSWRNVLTDEKLGVGSVPIAHLLRDFPVALLLRETDE